MKCTQCNKTLEETFLGKIKGTWEGKNAICSTCQKQRVATHSKKEKP
ncbi:MAG TPA: hypothetical protein VJB87_00630 [Candidatus Nanoarchaeia archaeon]|nr:hypothetical protein [Candidatus Nanoarchaeia archaeon]